MTMSCGQMTGKSRQARQNDRFRVGTENGGKAGELHSGKRTVDGEGYPLLDRRGVLEAHREVAGRVRVQRSRDEDVIRGVAMGGGG